MLEKSQRKKNFDEVLFVNVRYSSKKPYFGRDMNNLQKCVLNLCEPSLQPIAKTMAEALGMVLITESLLPFKANQLDAKVLKRVHEFTESGHVTFIFADFRLAQFGGFRKLMKNSKIPAIYLNKHCQPRHFKYVLLPIDKAKESKAKIIWGSFFGKKIGSTPVVLPQNQSEEVAQNALYAHKLYTSYQLAYDIKKENDERFPEATLRLAEKMPGLLILDSQEEFRFFDFSYKIKELQWVEHAKIPIMLLNPKLFYSPCH